MRGMFTSVITRSIFPGYWRDNSRPSCPSAAEITRYPAFCKRRVTNGCGSGARHQRQERRAGHLPKMGEPRVSWPRYSPGRSSKRIVSESSGAGGAHRLHQLSTFAKINGENTNTFSLPFDLHKSNVFYHAASNAHDGAGGNRNRNRSDALLMNTQSCRTQPVAQHITLPRGRLPWDATLGPHGRASGSRRHQAWRLTPGRMDNCLLVEDNRCWGPMSGQYCSPWGDVDSASREGIFVGPFVRKYANIVI